MSVYVTASAGSENTFTSVIKPHRGNLAYSISGTWSGTVTLQRSFDSGTTWLDVDSFTANQEGNINDSATSIVYRLGIKTGDYTSGTAEVMLAK